MIYRKKASSKGVGVDDIIEADVDLVSGGTHVHPFRLLLLQPGELLLHHSLKAWWTLHCKARGIHLILIVVLITEALIG